MPRLLAPLSLSLVFTTAATFRSQLANAEYEPEASPQYQVYILEHYPYWNIKFGDVYFTVPTVSKNW